MSFGCCNSFKECSDSGQCSHEGDTDYIGCEYKENLLKGLNFYTPYNDNNKRLKEKYEKSKVKPIIKEKSDFKGLFLEIENQVYSIGKRSSYHGYTTRLDKDKAQELKEKLDGFGVTSTVEPNKDMFPEIISSNEFSGNVILMLQGEKYNIKNPDHRAVKENIAVNIAKYLIKKGLNTDVEVLLGFKGSKVIKSAQVERRLDETFVPEKRQNGTKPKKNVIKKAKNVTKTSENGQLSLFDNKVEQVSGGGKKRIITPNILENYTHMRGTKVDRHCRECGNLIPRGTGTEFYTKIANSDYAPHIRNLCLKCGEKRIEKAS